MEESRKSWEVQQEAEKAIKDGDPEAFKSVLDKKPTDVELLIKEAIKTLIARKIYHRPESIYDRKDFYLPEIGYRGKITIGQLFGEKSYNSHEELISIFKEQYKEYYNPEQREEKIIEQREIVKLAMSKGKLVYNQESINLSQHLKMSGELQILALMPKIQQMSDTDKPYHDSPDKQVLASLKSRIEVAIGSAPDNESRKKQLTELSNKIWGYLKRLFIPREYHDQETKDLVINFFKPIVGVFLVEPDIKLKYYDDIDKVIGGKDEVGVYDPYEKKVEIVGGKKSSKEKISTLIHEIVHSVDHHLGKYEDKKDSSDYDYSTFHSSNSDNFREITQDLYDRYRSLRSPIPIKIGDGFIGSYADGIVGNRVTDKMILETMARGFQFLAMNGPEGLKILEEQSPKLLRYYQEVFIPKCLDYYVEKKSLEPEIEIEKINEQGFNSFFADDQLSEPQKNDSFSLGSVGDKISGTKKGIIKLPNTPLPASDDLAEDYNSFGLEGASTPRIAPGIININQITQTPPRTTYESRERQQYTPSSIFTTPEKSDKKEEHPKTTVARTSLSAKLTRSASSRSRSASSGNSGSDIDIDNI